jgi:hypothetical protein
MSTTTKAASAADVPVGGYLWHTDADGVTISGRVFERQINYTFINGTDGKQYALAHTEPVTVSPKPIVTHVDLSHRGVKLDVIHQFYEREDAESFAEGMRKRGYTAELREAPLATQWVKGSNLLDSDYLANGHVMITRLYFGGRGKVRVTGLRLDGKTSPRGRITVRRSFEFDQLVEIEARP